MEQTVFAVDTIRAPVCLILGLALMAGCLESETGDRVEGAPPTDEKAPQSSPYAITCPGGVSRYTSPGVCAGSIFNADESLAEPYVTAHPTRPGVFALGVNSLSARPQSAGSSVGHGIGVSLYVTEDYGASWVARPLPLQIGNYRGDPSLRFESHNYQFKILPWKIQGKILKAEEVGLEPTRPFQVTAFQAVAMAAMRLLQGYLLTCSLKLHVHDLF